ncbi:hypothetical protein BKP35_16960 [Anaerobacillus arseniciselenatis]|uniref:Uncharacterized protein n=1 Tax=Anaerobacillus arseniciselenatis TaxID=85682 RepID=A0A1S2LCU6_9BACI|nr:hypothetical protein [Anaerobacillus arseniciselenatis]OIJ09355.1 hypothetical protein BKP35_16960 [Anaerobacillus arseniciselenatis]
MVNVNFYEKEELILSQLLKNVPEEGAGVKIKGRKGKIIGVERTGRNSVNVQVELIAKNAEDSKKR